MGRLWIVGFMIFVLWKLTGGSDSVSLQHGVKVVDIQVQDAIKEPEPFEFKGYKITQLAKSPYMPECNGFNIQILANDQNHASLLESTLHTFIYNYTDNPIHILWKHKQKLMSDIISSEDSVYFPPNIQHKFWS